MAAYTPTVSFRGQKLTRRATSTTEDSYTFTLPSGGNPAGGGAPFSVQMVGTTAGLLYHSTATLTQSDGQPIAAGQSFTIPLGNSTTFYLSATGVGTVDMVVL